MHTTHVQDPILLQPLTLDCMDLVGISLSRVALCAAIQAACISYAACCAVLDSSNPAPPQSAAPCSAFLPFFETLMTAISCDRLLPCHLLPESLDFVTCLTVALGSKLYSISQRLNVLQTTTMILYRTHLRCSAFTPSGCWPLSRSNGFTFLGNQGHSFFIERLLEWLISAARPRFLDGCNDCPFAPGDLSTGPTHWLVHATPPGASCTRRQEATPIAPNTRQDCQQ